MKFMDLKIGESFFIVSEVRNALRLQQGEILRYEACEQVLVNNEKCNAYLPGQGQHQYVHPRAEVVVFGEYEYVPEWEQEERDNTREVKRHPDPVWILMDKDGVGILSPAFVGHAVFSSAVKAEDYLKDSEFGNDHMAVEKTWEELQRIFSDANFVTVDHKVGSKKKKVVRLHPFSKR